ncbi:MAG: FlgD immunoglobulin-like domain containing protein [Candidatus Zixiibacteriota bacterium]
MSKQLTKLLTLCVIGLCCLAFSSPAVAAGGDSALPDSVRQLMNKTALTGEPSLQHIFDSLGYNINVATDETGIETFCTSPGQNLATIVIEVAGSAASARSGWYRSTIPGTLNTIFNPSDGAGDSVSFSVTGGDSIGFWMKPRLAPDTNQVWYTQNYLNSDSFDHAKVFRTGMPHEFIVAFEDLPDGGDMDWNDLVFKVRFSNNAPVVTLPADINVLQCSLAQICFAVNASDPDCQGDTITVTKQSGPGTFTQIKQKGSVSANFCWTPASAGTFAFVFKVRDELDATDYDTINVTVTLNQAPIANAGSDSTLSQCTPAPICIAASCSDPNGNLSTCQLVSGPGTYDGANICFTPAASGSYTLVLKATDACGLTDYDTSVVNVTLNEAPVANAGSDSTLSQCTPAPICIAASCSDPNGNLSTCQLVSGPGTYDGTNICFTPAASGSYTLVLKATDACGLTDYDTSVVTVTLNAPPVATLGSDSTVFQCGPAQICIPGICSDPDGNLSTCQLVSGPGSYDGANVCFTPAGAGVYTFVLKATDACGATDFDTATVTVAVNQAPVADAGRDSTLFQCAPAQICIAADCTDPNANLTNCELTSGPGTLSAGSICFTPAASGTYTFIVKATDACGETDFDTSVVNVTINQAPVANAGIDSTLFQCAPAPICITAACSDPDANLSTCQLVSGPGAYDGSQICFTPAASGVYTMVLKATDACGLTDFDTSVVTVTVNSAPVADAGRDSTLFQCAPAQICIAAACTDINNNLTTCQLISGPGTYNGSQICFTPAGAGAYTFVVQATDACGATDLDTSVVNVSINSAPVANCHGDTTVFACSLAQICIPGFSASDPNGNIATTTVTGGALNAGSVCFTPVAGPNTIQMIVTDACGLADTCQTVVTVVQNAPPVANAGADQTLACQVVGQQICWVAGCADPNSNLTDCSLVSGPGSYNGSQICFTPASSGSYSFVLRATDACGAMDYDTAVVTVRLNSGPSASVDPGDTTIFCSETGPMQICVPFSYSDPNGNVQTVSVSPAPSTLNYANGSGLFCFTPPSSFDDQYSFTVTVTDSCGSDVQTTHTRWVRFIDCDTATCFIVKTEKTHNTLQGHFEYVSVTVEGAGQNFGGFDFLLSYDNSALNFIDAQPGTMLTTCGWEYFTFRYGAQGNCSGSCPSGLVRVVSIADANNGANHPSCYGPALPSPQEMFKLKFLVTNDRTFECQYVPIRFFWLDCGDNGISTVSGDTLYLEKRIFSFEGNAVWDEFDDAQFPDYNRPFGVGAQDFCMLGDKYEPIRCIEFWEGGVDIVCADSIDAPGDMNLNDISYEIADAVLYTNYFLYGLAALDPDPQRREAQIAASDANRDGTTLSVGDLVYLVRVIVGDALPFGKLAPFTNAVVVHQDDDIISTESGVDLGAVLFTFNVGADYTISGLTDMTVAQSEAANGQVKVLIYDISSKSIAAGVTPLLQVSGDVELVSSEIADYNGNGMNARLDKNVLPTHFALSQNYPNPFNPETLIEFALPKSANVVLTIINTAGQKVATVLNGVMSAGRHQVRWDGKDGSGNQVSSGVYLYKFESAGFTETRKMLLVK